jgi:biofilm PGA synthesis N-glycosyltransferase PgaC
MVEIPGKLGKVAWDDLIVSTSKARADADAFSEKFYTKETGFSVSVGIPAYNEENNIANLLNALLKQRTNIVDINEIIVISSGSTDRTNIIVEELSQKECRIRLIKQDKREGKASAINKFLKAARNEILILESADTIPDYLAIEKLCLPFENPLVGMTGAHPIPTNNENSFMGYTSHLVWVLHDLMALRSPKCGELVAFRKIFETLPEDIAVDEAWIEYETRKRNYEIVYVSDAIVYNRGPETIGDFLKQRRRIACGHLDLSKRTKFEVSTTKYNSLLLSAIFTVFPRKEPRKWCFLIGALALEGLSRFLGYCDYYKKQGQYSIWEISKTTKSLDLYAPQAPFV